jgi:carbamate kinase
MLVVLALGGNALLRRGQPLEAELQRRNLLVAAKALAPIARKHQVVITHGNGPQVGLLALQAAAYKDVQPYPLDILGAESEGMIGYLIEQGLANELPDREIVTLLTQVEVETDDPAFANPSKPIGPIYGEAEARLLATRSGWALIPDGPGFRRAVASPAPRRIREINAIKLLIRSRTIVIAQAAAAFPWWLPPPAVSRGSRR